MSEKMKQAVPEKRKKLEGNKVMIVAKENFYRTFIKVAQAIPCTKTPRTVLVRGTRNHAGGQVCFCIGCCTVKKMVHALVWLELQTIISLAFLDVAAVV